MRRALGALALSFVLAGTHGLLRGLGLAEHTSAIAGMPIDGWSLPVAALYVVTYLAAIVVAPILALGALVELALVYTDLRRKAGA